MPDLSTTSAAPSDLPAAPAHLCLVQPAGYVHSMALLDPLLHLQGSLAELGLAVSSAKNRLRAGAVNLVLGAHLGFDPAWVEQHQCVFVNLEQLGDGGAHVPSAYLRLLRENPAIDYHEDNVLAYAEDPGSVPVVAFGHAPHLEPEQHVPLEEREIDLLFLGSVTERRRVLLERIAATGVRVVVPEGAVYGPERDHLIRSARAVINLSAYDAARFEQVRASLVLSCGTPLISERRTLSTPGERAYEPFVDWCRVDGLEEHFTQWFASPGWYQTAREALEAFRGYRTTRSVAAAWRQHGRPPAVAPSPRYPLKVNLDVRPGGYRPGWLNIGTDPRALPDVHVDDLRDVVGRTSAPTSWWGEVPLGRAELAHLGAVEPTRSDAGAKLAAALHLLADGGLAVVEWPAGAGTAPLEEVTDRFWESGSVGRRFEVTRVDPVSSDGLPCTPAAAARLRIVLRTTPCSVHAVTVARAALEDYGFLHCPAPPSSP